MKFGKLWQILAVTAALILAFPAVGQAAAYKEGPVA